MKKVDLWGGTIYIYISDGFFEAIPDSLIMNQIALGELSM